MKNLNLAMYKALSALFNAHINNGGPLDYSEKEYTYISELLDYIDVFYFEKTPDGDYQNELFEETKKIDYRKPSELEVYNEILVRLNNTNLI